MEATTTITKRRATPPAAATRGKLRAARQAAKLTQMELAVCSGLSLATVSTAERTGFMTLATATRLATVLGVVVKEIQ